MIKLTDKNYELIFLCRHFRRIAAFMVVSGRLKGNNTYRALVFIIFRFIVGGLE